MERQGKNRYGTKILSFGIACLIWLLVTYINDPVTTRRFSDVEVTVLNADALEEKGYTYDIEEGKEISFTVKGNRRLVSSLTTSDFEVTADFKKLSIMDAVPIEVVAKHDNNRLEITKLTDTMIIHKDKGITMSIPVNTVEKGTPDKGFAVGETSATPNLIKVKGPKSVLLDAKEIRVSVDVSNASGDVVGTDTPRLYNENGNIIISKQIEFDTEKVEVAAVIWRTKDVNVHLESEGEPADGYKMTSFDYEPKVITVAAEDEVLEELKEIDLGIVSVDGLKKDHEENINLAEVNFPEGVAPTKDVTDIKVKAVIEKKSTMTKMISQSDIAVRGNTRGYKIRYLDDSDFKISVNGAKTEVDELDSKDFRPWIDVAGMNEGEHEVTLHVKEPDGVSVEGTGKLKITLRK